MGLSSNESARVSVLLANLGGPETLDDIPHFLFDLFMDREIIPIPVSGMLRKPLAYWLARKRAARVRERYALIGNGSPLVSLTRQQADALSRIFENQQKQYHLSIAMRYGKPSLEKTLSTLPGTVTDLVVIPLFPQYCRATTGTLIKEIKRLLSRQRSTIKLHWCHSFHKEPLYIRSMSKLIAREIDTLSNEKNGDYRIIFCAHSVPVSFIRKGDPYISHIESSARDISRHLDLEDDRWQIAYQSQVGPVEWVGPTVEQVFKEMAAKKINHVICVPVSFVSDHLETLYDMDIDIARKAAALGFQSCIRVPCLNEDPDFIALLDYLVEKALASDV